MFGWRAGAAYPKNYDEKRRIVAAETCGCEPEETKRVFVVVAL